jgi:predicted CopG family antitoxin
MKRITISIDDDIYASLIDYAADSCKEELSRLSVSRSIRKLLATRLEELDYYPVSQEKKKQELAPQQVMPAQEKHTG